MKIIIDARELRTSTGRYVERLLHYLQKVDFDNDYMVLLKPKDMLGWRPTNPHFQKIACSYKEFSFGEQLGFAWQLYKLKPDLVHFTMPQQPVLYFGRSVTTIHDLTTIRFRNPSKNYLVFNIKQRVYKKVIRMAARRSKLVIAISEFTKTDLVRFTKINPNKVVVTYESADAIDSKPELIPKLAGKHFIMYVGRPQPHKNLRRLIDAFIILQKNYPDLWLVLAGKKDGLYAQHERYARKHGIKNIFFAGFVSEGELRWLYENCLVYTFPSLSEGFGLPALEAMRAGAPVASSNASCLPEIYGKAAAYFDPLDVPAMAKTIDKLLDNPKRRQKLIAAGKKQVAKYSWLRMAEQTLEVYKKALLG